MLDWLASKLGVLIAVGVLTTFALGLFAWQHSSAVDMEGQAVADRIAGTLDAMAGLDATSVMAVSYGTGADQLPLTIDGDGYTVNVTSDSVIVSCDGDRWVSSLVSRVVPRNLTDREMNLSAAEELEDLAWSGEMPSGDAFVMERALIDISGEARYITLVYWDG